MDWSAHGVDECATTLVDHRMRPASQPVGADDGEDDGEDDDWRFEETALVLPRKPAGSNPPAAVAKGSNAFSVDMAPDTAGVPAVIGSYRVVRRIGAGAMGVVYEGVHSCLDRRVAIKVLRREVAGQRGVTQRFLGEAIAASASRHPGIVEIYDYGQLDGGAAYMVMEYLDGVTLEDRLEADAPLSFDDAIDIAQQIARALSRAHDAGIVHRDLKPANIALCPDPQRPGRVRVKVFDFGVAKQAPTSAREWDPTECGAVLGTPAYMAPEQCRSSTEARPTSDIYALGCVLYHMLCGRPPFVGSLAQVLSDHLGKPPERPSDVRGDEIPAALETIVGQMLAKDPGSRPANMDMVAYSLDRLSRPPVAEVAAVDRPRRRSHAAFVAVSLMLCAAAVAMALVLAAAT